MNIRFFDSSPIIRVLRTFYAEFYCIFLKFAKILLDFTRVFMYNVISEEGGDAISNSIIPEFGKASQEGQMIVNGPQNVYNALPNLENQNLVSRPDFNRNLGTGTTPSLDEQTQSDQQSQNAIQQAVDVSLQEIKDLSDIYNAYQSYVNQIDASNRLVGRVSYGSGGVLDLISG